MSSTYLRDLEKIGPGAVFAVLTLLLLVSPGVAVVYVFLPELFVRLDTFKLMLLSASTVVPFVAALFIPVSLWWMGLKPKKSAQTGVPIQFAGLLIATLLSSMMLYAAVLVSKLIGLSFAAFVGLCVAITLVICLGLTCLAIKQSSVS